MSLVTVRLLSVVSVIALAQADEQVPLEARLVAGSDNFKYFSTEAEETAKILINYKKNIKIALSRYIKDLKRSNAASKALDQYNDKKDSLKDTKCVDEEVEDHFTGAQENIETIVDTCGASVPRDDIDKLNKAVMEALVKVQQADLQLLMNAKACSQLKKDPPAYCEDDKQKALNTIKSTVSYASVTRISYFARNAFFNTKLAIDSCVEDGTRDLKGTLDEWNKKLDDCKKNIQK